MTEALETLAQQAATDDIVHLYALDATSLGGEIYRFTSSAFEALPVTWQGNIYAPVPVETEGWEWNGSGSLPTPTLKVSNIGNGFGGAVIGFGDLVGCPFVRTRTFRRFLDGQPDADPAAHFPLDVYRVEQKTSHNKVFIEWKLAAAFDHEGRLLPGRQVLRDTCTHRYRRWNGTAFDFTKATCPYVGDLFFTTTGAATADPAEDRCGKRLSDCKKRFADDPLPTRAFPGVSRIRL